MSWMESFDRLGAVGLKTKKDEVPRFAHVYQERIESAGRWCVRHDAVLRWIKQICSLMAVQHGTSTAKGTDNEGGDGGDGNAAVAFRRHLKTPSKRKLHKTRAMLGDPGISKSKRRLWSRPFTTTTTLDAPSAASLAVEQPAPPEAFMSRASKRRQGKSKNTG